MSPFLSLLTPRTPPPHRSQLETSSPPPWSWCLPRGTCTMSHAPSSSRCGSSSGVLLRTVGAPCAPHVVARTRVGQEDTDTPDVYSLYVYVHAVYLLLCLPSPPLPSPPLPPLPSTLTHPSEPYPMLILCGPLGAGKGYMSRRLVEDFPTYFGLG